MGMANYRHYRNGLFCFFHIYGAIERTWSELLNSPTTDHRSRTLLEALYDPRLRRHDALKADLTYLHGPDGVFNPWSLDLPTPVTDGYAMYIEKSIGSKPYLLVAYAHQYYMALFAGGRILERKLLETTDFLPVWGPAADYGEALKYGSNLFQFPSTRARSRTSEQSFGRPCSWSKHI